MAENQYRVRPLSRCKIRTLANHIRRIIGCYETIDFPVLYFFEFIMPILRPGYDWEIVSQDELGDDHGKTLPMRNKILIREDVYDRAEAGEGRDRMTIIHECFHLLQHADQEVAFARTFNSSELKPYESSEWQAKAFAGELLIPKHLCQGMTLSQIADTCGVSYEAARYQIKQWGGGA